MNVWLREYNSTKKLGAPWKYVDFTPFNSISKAAELRKSDWLRKNQIQIHVLDFDSVLVPTLSKNSLFQIDVFDFERFSVRQLLERKKD